MLHDQRDDSHFCRKWRQSFSLMFELPRLCYSDSIMFLDLHNWVQYHFAWVEKPKTKLTQTLMHHCLISRILIVSMVWKSYECFPPSARAIWQKSQIIALPYVSCALHLQCLQHFQHLRGVISTGPCISSILACQWYSIHLHYMVTDGQQGHAWHSSQSGPVPLRIHPCHHIQMDFLLAVPLLSAAHNKR